MAKQSPSLPGPSLDLFAAGPRTSEVINVPDADIRFYPQFFSPSESDAFLAELMNSTDWKQEKISYYGKLMNLPRLTAWYGDTGKTYKYSGITVDARPWTPILLAIKREIETVTPASFNSVLLNLYRSERDSVAWHSDDEPELGRNPIIGSVSLGETRTFYFRHKRNEELKARVELSHGSYLLMQGPTQHHWQHQIAKTTRSCGPRINLTFRSIK